MQEQSFTQFLNTKLLYYDKIDYTIINKTWQIIKQHIDIPYVIHIVGTNGKGTTGRFISSFLYQKGYKVLHYTSPHIKKFNERIWINGSDVLDKDLDNAHNILKAILPIELLSKLTYFEYTTIIALYLSSGFDYIVLEAGLGGEFDATNVVDNDLTVVPTVGLDHIEFLGNSIEQIATTKLKSCDKVYILGLGIDPIVKKIANTILYDKQELLLNQNLVLPQNANLLPTYLQSNLLLAVNVLKYLHISTNNLVIPQLPGRMEKLTSNITLDVGHNPLAAQVIAKELIEKKLVLIYNCYKDKDYKEVLTILKPIVKRIEIIKCDDERIVDANLLFKVIKNLNLDVDYFDISNLSDDEEYLVFGSFKVVEEFLKQYEK